MQCTNVHPTWDSSPRFHAHTGPRSSRPSGTQRPPEIQGSPPPLGLGVFTPPKMPRRGADGRTPQFATTPRRYRRRGVALHGGDEAPTAAKAPRVVGGHPVTPAYGRSRPAILPPDAGGTRTHLTMTKVPNPPKQTKRLHKRPAQAVDRAPTTAPAPRQTGVHLLVSRNAPIRGTQAPDLCRAATESRDPSVSRDRRPPVPSLTGLGHSPPTRGQTLDHTPGPRGRSPTPWPTPPEGRGSQEQRPRRYHSPGGAVPLEKRGLSGTSPPRGDTPTQ